MPLKRFFLIGTSLGLSQLSYANSEVENRVREQCNKLPYTIQRGDKAYQNKQYKEALKFFEQQASLIDFCSINEDITGEMIPKHQASIAYNNVGLAYAKLNQPRWAKAWYSILPKDEKSKFNLSKLPQIKPTTDKTGVYVKYIGQGQWDNIKVSKGRSGYDIEYVGLRMGTNGMIYGPNLGNFTTTMANSSNKARYKDDSCIIDLEFDRGESIRVKQNQPNCGFGMGVYAQGFYLKVEKSIE